jgi:hypothetical protein
VKSAAALQKPAGVNARVTASRKAVLSVESGF